MTQIVIANADDCSTNNDFLHGVFRFRHRIFYERLGWEVKHENGEERDSYDDLNPVYIVAKNQRSEIEGCARLLPTMGPYMLKNTFPQLLCGGAAPENPTIWELSRLAVSPTSNCSRGGRALRALTLEMMQALVRFANQQGIRQYIVVTSVSFERLLVRIGLPIYRFQGLAPQRIGKVNTVACWVDINDQTLYAVRSSGIKTPEHKEAA